MYSTQASVSWWTWPLHVALVVIGMYLIANLALAVIFINFTKYYEISKKDHESGNSYNSHCSPCAEPLGYSITSRL